MLTARKLTGRRCAPNTAMIFKHPDNTMLWPFSEPFLATNQPHDLSHELTTRTSSHSTSHRSRRTHYTSTPMRTPSYKRNRVVHVIFCTQLAHAASTPAQPTASVAAPTAPAGGYSATDSQLLSGSALEGAVNSICEMGFEKEQVHEVVCVCVCAHAV
jgi:hypothetical protein